MKGLLEENRRIITHQETNIETSCGRYKTNRTVSLEDAEAHLK